jgi:hypothetical protein
MTRRGRPVERLKEALGVKRLRRFIYITNLLEEGEGEETPYTVKVSSELWPHATGGPFTSDEIRALRKTH